MKLYIASDDRAHAILVADEEHNDIAEFFHSDHATVGQSYETALALAQKLVTLNEPQSVAWPPIALGDMAYMNERSPYFHDWKGVSLKVVSLRIEPDGKLWASVIEGEQRHRGNGVYDAETTDVDAEHLSPLSRPAGGSE